MMQDKLPFDNVYSDRYNGMDTYSHLGVDNFGGMRQHSARDSYQSPLRGAGTSIGRTPAFAGNATRSQITFANFGGSQTDTSSAPTTSRFAGRATRSNISIANFGGDPNLPFPSRVSQPTNSNLDTNRDPQTREPYSFYQQDEYPRQQETYSPPRYHDDTFGYHSVEQPHPVNSPSGGGSSMFADRLEGRFESAKRLPDEKALEAVVAPMIREIAELRVRNQELEDLVSLLRRKLAHHEPDHPY